MSPNKENQPSSFPMSKNASGVSEEAAIFNTFMLIIRNKFIATTNSPTHEGEKKTIRLDELYSSSGYEAEKKKLAEMNRNGMVQGIAVGLFTFAFLRSGPRMMNRFLSRSRSQVGGGYQFDLRNPSKQMTQPDPDIPRPGFFFRTIKFGLDVVVSLSLAAYGSAYFTDGKTLMNELSEIPLIEGRSLISDELCDDFIDVYKSIPKKTWDKYHGKSEPIDAIGQFVRNCLRRHSFEKKVLAERDSFRRSVGSDSGEKHVVIPHPGVPRDIEVEIPWIDKSEDLRIERDMTGFGGDDEFEADFGLGWNDENNSAGSDENNEKDWK